MNQPVVDGFRQGRVRTPTLLQMEMVECGAACLGVLLAFYGRIVPLAELRRACGVSRDGSKASSLVQAARGYGLDAKAFKKDIEELHDLDYPFIVFWNFNHYVVVEGVRKDRVFINDPSTGPRTISRTEFAEAFTGVALVMTPTATFEKGGHRPSVMHGLWARLRSSLGTFVLCGVTALLCLKATRILIAHRMSTIRQADRIYVIEKGRVVQTGTFESLMSEEGLFARLMRRQVA